MLLIMHLQKLEYSQAAGSVRHGQHAYSHGAVLAQRSASLGPNPESWHACTGSLLRMHRQPFAHTGRDALCQGMPSYAHL